MDANTPRPKRQDGVVTSLNIAIEAMNLAKEASSVTPAKAVFGVVSILLTMIKVRLIFCDGELLIHIYSGLCVQQNRLCRARVSVRRGMQGP